MTAGKENLQNRIEIVKRIVDENYEHGNQKKCKLQIYRFNVKPSYPMSERTFWRYISAHLDKKKRQEEWNKRQLNIDF